MAARILSTRRHLVRALVAVALSFVATGCGDPPITPRPTPIASLTVTCPSGASALSLRNQPVAVTWDAPATTGGVAPVTVTCTPAAGSAFAPGTATVVCTAVDAANQQSTCGFAVTITRPPQVSVTRFLAYGDSITWGRDAPEGLVFGFPEPPPSTSYPSQLSGWLTARYADQDITLVNEGWPGEDTATGASRLPGVLAATQPQVVLLLHGANDLLNKPESSTTSVIASRLRDMVRTAKQRIPNVRVLLANFPPQYHGTAPYDRGAGADLVPELNGRIAQVAQSEGVTLVDLYGPMLPDLKRNIGTDGLHPTVRGFTVMADTFSAAIQQQFEASAGGLGLSR